MVLNGAIMVSNGLERPRQVGRAGALYSDAVDREDIVNEKLLRSQFRGCLIGGAVGDALGMPTEEGPSRPPGRSIQETFNVDRVVDYIDSPNPKFLKAGQYTDDTQQTICLAETLLEGNGRFEPRRFFDKLSEAVRGKMRGVGPSTMRVLDALAAGHVQELLQGQFTSASPSNGGAMRIAPVALLFHHDTVELRRQVVQVTRVTHNHPVAIAGACAQAFLIASRVGERPESLDPGRLRQELAAFVAPVHEGFAEQLAGQGAGRAPGRSCWVEDTVPPVVDAFLSGPESWEDGVLEQVNSDGDTDTKASMLGSVLGAHHGLEAIPGGWIERLENDHKGREHLFLLADELLLVWLRMAGAGDSKDS